MPAQHKTELSKELYFKTVTFNFIITFLIFFSSSVWTLSLEPFYQAVSAVSAGRANRANVLLPSALQWHSLLACTQRSLHCTNLSWSKSFSLGSPRDLCVHRFSGHGGAGRERFNSVRDSKAEPSGWVAFFFFFRTRTALLFCPPRAWEALLTWVVLLTGMGLLKFGGTGPRWEQWNIPWKIWCTPRNANSHRYNFSLYKILSSALFLFMHLLLWKMTCISKIR